jgi:hypothetical protein
VWSWTRWDSRTWIRRFSEFPGRTEVESRDL